MKSFAEWKMGTATGKLCLGAFVGLLLCTSFFTDCTRDPEIRKLNYFNSATRYFEKGKYREASLELRNAIRIDPRYADAHYLLARSYLQMGFVNQAVQELSSTVDLAPQNWKAQIDLGNLLFSIRDYERASNKAQLVLSSQPQNADAHALLAKVAAVQGHLDQALIEMKESVKLAPTASNYIDLGALESKAQAPSNAEESIKKAISLDPKGVGPTMALGALYVQLHRFDDLRIEQADDVRRR